MIKVMYAEFDAAHRRDFVFDLPQGHDGFLLLLTQTPAIFWVDGQLTTCPANSAILYKPHQKIYYCACEDRYVNDWVRFLTDESYVAQSPIPCGIPFTPQDPIYLHKLFQLITREFESSGALKQVLLDKLLQVMFHKLAESYQGQHATLVMKNVSDLKNDIYAHPGLDWSIKLMTDKLNISAGHLETLYRELFGVSCMADVINSRIARAKQYLSGSHYSIAEIVSFCGYHNAEHFYRQFKKITGMTPKQYRALQSLV
ncbi:MAG: AraC family transcriptional regulator [Oscillospiraceae bacterium]|jgi:AraC-like DNA-binding protein|nr:AraC family transcriptional regulator [Oscillospiraceae bacterium]